MDETGRVNEVNEGRVNEVLSIGIKISGQLKPENKLEHIIKSYMHPKEAELEGNSVIDIGFLLGNRAGRYQGQKS